MPRRLADQEIAQVLYPGERRILVRRSSHFGYTVEVVVPVRVKLEFDSVAEYRAWARSVPIKPVRISVVYDDVKEFDSDYE